MRQAEHKIALQWWQAASAATSGWFAQKDCMAQAMDCGTSSEFSIIVEREDGLLHVNVRSSLRV